MKIAMRCFSPMFLTWMVWCAAADARADFVLVSPYNEAAAGFIEFQLGPITYPGGGPFLTAAILNDRYVESAILFDLRRFRALDATIHRAELTVAAVAYDSTGPSGPTIFADGLTNATGRLQASDFPIPGAPLPAIGSYTLPTPGSIDDTANVAFTFDATAFLSGQLAAGADFAGILFRARTLGDVVDLASTSAPARAQPPSLAVTYTVPTPGSLTLYGEVCLAALGFACARRNPTSGKLSVG